MVRCSRRPAHRCHLRGPCTLPSRTLSPTPWHARAAFLAYIQLRVLSCQRAPVRALPSRCSPRAALYALAPSPSRSSAAARHLLQCKLARHLLRHSCRQRQAGRAVHASMRVRRLAIESFAPAPASHSAGGVDSCHGPQSGRQASTKRALTRAYSPSVAPLLACSLAILLVCSERLLTFPRGAPGDYQSEVTPSTLLPQPTPPPPAPLSGRVRAEPAARGWRA